MKTTTNKAIFENVVNNGFISEREIDIIKNATPEDFMFCGFYDAGNRYFSVFMPVYRCGAMEYYVSGGKIQVVG